MYFTKYLPVEGEIKKGDKLIDNRMPNIGIVEALTDNEGKRLYENGSVKYKLFLCSRDIQVDDKVMCNYVGGKEREWTVVAKADKSRSNIHIKAALQLKAYKVIGEISSDATWVKEGDEFEEEQQIKISKRYYTSITDKTGYVEVEINCPTCNTFH